MSRIALTPNNSGTGTFTIASPGTNTDRTITLPDATGTVNISGLANEVPAGSAGAPAIYPTGDTNTGIFFPAADTIAFAEGGVESMRIDASGNLLVGTTTTDIYGFGSYRRLNLSTASGYSILTVAGGAGTGGELDFGDQSVRHAAIASLTGSHLAFYTNATNSGSSVAERARITSGGDFQFNSGFGSVSTVYGCRAWVNFNGTNGAIRGSGGVSSVTYNGVGTSTVNFTTAMPDTNYSAVCSGHGAGFGRQANAFPNYLGYATGSINVWYGNTINAAAENLTTINVAVFR